MRYRVEIDGLRGIAVLAVVLFHIDLSFLRGGFVGVDFFFVLSGYLITANVRDTILKKSFSFRSFYTRRIFRLFPALLVTVATTFLLATLTFTNHDLQRLAHSSSLSLLSLSNIGFWRESGYFDSKAVRKALLHTWSLAIEEHFFFFWPAALKLLLSTTSSKSNRLQCTFIFLLALSSLCASQTMVISGHASTAFFLGPFRAYEFMFGAILHWLPALSSQSWKTLLTVLGCFLQFGSLFFMHPGLRFPGLYATIPCLGTALVLHCSSATPIARKLSNPILLYIGRVSYSFYLTHWPIIVIYKYATSHEVLNSSDRIFLFSSSLLSAHILHRNVETRFYTRPHKKPILPKSKSQTPQSNGNLLRLSFVTLTLLCIFQHCQKTKGWQWRSTPRNYSAETITEVSKTLGEFDALVHDYHKSRRSRKFDEHGPLAGSTDSPASHMLLLGDSLAHQFLPLAHYYGKKYNISFHVWWYGACAPVISARTLYNRDDFGADTQSREDECVKRVQEWFADISRFNFTAVFIAARWLRFLEPSANIPNTAPIPPMYVMQHGDILTKPTIELTRSLLNSALNDAINRVKLANATAVIVSQAPMPGLNPIDCLSQPRLFKGRRSETQHAGCVRATRDQMLHQIIGSDTFLKRISAQSSARFLPVSSLICDNEKEDMHFCRVVWYNKVLYRNAEHLSDDGAMYIALRWEQRFKDLLGNVV